MIVLATGSAEALTTAGCRVHGLRSAAPTAKHAGQVADVRNTDAVAGTPRGVDAVRHQAAHPRRAHLRPRRPPPCPALA